MRGEGGKGPDAEGNGGVRTWGSGGERGRSVKARYGAAAGQGWGHRKGESEEGTAAECALHSSIFSMPPHTLPHTSPLPTLSRRREEEEELINLLRMEELEAKRREEELAAKRKQERLKAEIMAANEQQKRLKEEREAAYQAEEEEYRRQLLAKFAEDDRIEQLNQQKRRMKVRRRGSQG